MIDYGVFRFFYRNAEGNFPPLKIRRLRLAQDTVGKMEKKQYKLILKIQARTMLEAQKNVNRIIDEQKTKMVVQK